MPASLVGVGVIESFHTGSSPIAIPFRGSVAAGQTLVIVTFDHTCALGNTVATLTDSKGNTYKFWGGGNDAGLGFNGYALTVYTSLISNPLTSADALTFTWPGGASARFYCVAVELGDIGVGTPAPTPAAEVVAASGPLASRDQFGLAAPGQVRMGFLDPTFDPTYGTLAPAVPCLAVAASVWTAGPLTDDPNWTTLLNFDDGNGDLCLLSYAYFEDGLTSYTAHGSGDAVGWIGAFYEANGRTSSTPPATITGGTVTPDTSVPGALDRVDITATGVMSWDAGHYLGTFFDGSAVYNYPPYIGDPTDPGSGAGGFLGNLLAEGVWLGIPFSLYSAPGLFAGGAIDPTIWFEYLTPPVPGYLLGYVPYEIAVTLAFTATLTDAKSLVGGGSPVNLGHHEDTQLLSVASGTIAYGTLIDGSGTHTLVPLETADSSGGVTFIWRQLIPPTALQWWKGIVGTTLVEMTDAVFNSLSISYSLTLSLYLGPDTRPRIVTWPPAPQPAGAYCPAVVN